MTYLVILLNDNPILGDVAESDIFIGNAGDGSSGSVDGLDADAVLGVLDRRA